VSSLDCRGLQVLPLRLRAQARERGHRFTIRLGCRSGRVPGTGRRPLS
jgi:hypothetical protein